jgi:hypothetical protein
LIEGEALHAMNGARILRRNANAGAAQIEDDDLVSCAVHLGDATIGQWAQARGNLALSNAAKGLSRAAGLVDHAGAEARQRFTKILCLYRRGEARRQFLRAHARRTSLWRALRHAVKRPLTKRDLADTTPTQMGIDAFDDKSGRMLGLQRKGALDPKDQRRRAGRRIGIASRSARRPLHFNRPAMPRDMRARYLRPLGHQACLAKALPREGGFNELRQERAERHSLTTPPVWWFRHLRSFFMGLVRL